MQSDSMRVTMRDVWRLLSRGLLLLIAFALTQAASAQQAEPLSPSVVLVLKLVSATHVKPTTGVVISGDGLVLVPAEFASGEGEMIVLDGGTDILSNGRPAQVHALTATGDMAVLSVQGLKRPGITLSDNAWDEDNTRHLEAFPPADQIAKGANPLWVPLDVQPGPRLSISSATPLPYVSGAIIDGCGYLAGVSLSTGTQSLETLKSPTVLVNEQLKPIFEQLQISLPSARCVLEVQAEEAPVVAPEPNRPAEESADSRTPEPEDKEPENKPEQSTGTLEDEPTMAESVKEKAVPAPTVKTSVSEPASIWRSLPWWIPVLGILILAVLIWKLVFFFRLQKNEAGQEKMLAGTDSILSASDEPVTAPLETISGESIVKPRSAPELDLEIPGADDRPDGCDAVLVVEGQLDAETGFRQFCFVNSAQLNVVIGRGGADIAIEHAAISRRHVRIESDGASLTLSDLGSRNGTFVGNVPCLPGEVLFFEETDEIFLGDLKISLRLVKQKAEWA